MPPAIDRVAELRSLVAPDLAAIAELLRGTAEERAREKVVEIEARSPAPDDVRAAYVAFWEALTNITERLEPGTWDAVLCDVGGSDTGALSGRPVKCLLPFAIPQAPSEEEQEHFACVGSEWVSATIPGENPLASLGEDYDEFDERVEVLLEADVKSRANALAEAAQDPKLRAAMQAFGDRARFGVLWTSGVTVPHESLVSTLFGAPLSKPPQPKTAYGVFARLLQSMESYVGKSNTCFQWNGDELVGFVFFGHSASDATVALLDDVKNVARVCRSIRTITLESTRISEAGIAKLQAKFPDARVVQSA